MDFEMKLERELLEFTPAAVKNYSLVNVECDEDYTIKMYTDSHSCNVLSVFHSQSKSDDCRGLSRYLYQSLFDGDIMMHRIGGPAEYTYDALLNKITHIEFWYLNRKYSEREYWCKMSSLRSLNCYEDSVIEGKNFQQLRIEFKASRSVMIPSCYFYKTGKFEYKIKGRKFNRSVFYKQLEEKVACLQG